MRSSYSSGAHPRGTSWAINSPSPIVNFAARPEKRFSHGIRHGRIWPLSSSCFILLWAMADGPSAGDHAGCIHCMHWYNLSDGASAKMPSNRLPAPVCLIISIAPRRIAPPSWISATCSSSINWPVNCSRPSIAGWPKQASWWPAALWCHHHWRQRLPRTKSSNAIRDASDQERQSVALLAWRPTLVSMPRVAPTARVTTAANEHDLNQLGNLLHGEEQFVQPMPATKERHSARSWLRWIGLADRRASRQGKTLAASAQEQNGHQHRIHESQHPCQGSTRSHHQAAVRLRESQIQGAAENDNQLAMLFTLTCFVDQMIRQWDPRKTGNNAKNGGKLNRLIWCLVEKNRPRSAKF